MALTDEQKAKAAAMASNTQPDHLTDSGGSTGGYTRPSKDDGDEKTPFEEEFGPGSEFSPISAAIDSLEDQFLDGAAASGWDESVAKGWFDSKRLELATYLNEELIPSVFGGQNEEGTGIGAPLDEDYEANTLMDFEIVRKFGQNWLSQFGKEVAMTFNPSLRPRGNRTNRGGGGGSGGAAGLTPEQIRNQFDIDQLTELVSEQWRGTLLERAKDPRGIAQAYVEAIVATGGEKKIDFDTYVQGRIRKDPRYSEIYKNKPESMSEGQFMAPYLNTATQVLRPKNVGEKARAGAQLGSSPDSFRANLARSDEVTGSANFITSMEQRLTDVKGIFRG